MRMLTDAQIFTGDRIKQIREGHGWSQKRLAEYLGVQQATVSRLEAGQWAVPGPIQRLLLQLETRPAHMDAAS